MVVAAASRRNKHVRRDILLLASRESDWNTEAKAFLHCVLMLISIS